MQVRVIEGDTAAQAAHREGGAHDDRVSAQGIGPRAALIHGVGDDAAGDLGATTLDDVLELVTVLPGVDGRGGGADELDVILLEHTPLDQAHGGVEGRLPHPRVGRRASGRSLAMMVVRTSGVIGSM